MSEPAIVVEDLRKCYRLGVIGTGTFYGDLKRWWALRRGLPDPYAQVGGAASVAGKTDETLWALNGVSFTIEQGQAVGIIGRNGAGKSTLAKILSRVTAPTSGEVKVKGRIASLLEVGTGFHPELTGRENIFLNGAIMGMTRGDITAKFDEIVEFSGVGRFIDTPVKRYSSGMYVRLAFAVAAHLEPEILIVDEVLAVGDAEFQKKCLGKMGQVANQGRTVLFVSHNLGAINALCPQTLWMDRGQLRRMGDSSETIKEYLNATEGVQSGVVEFKEGSGDGFFTRVGIVDERGAFTPNISVLESFSLRFQYTTPEPLPGLEVAFSLFDKHGSKIFHSATPAGAERGAHVAEVQIPGHFMAPGSYSINAVLHQPNVRFIDKRDEVLRLTVVETGSGDYKYLNQDCGAVLVSFPWKVAVAVS